MGLISKIFDTRERQLETAWKRYCELLEGDSDSAADVREIGQLMATLSRTPDDVAADQQIIRHFRDALKYVVDAVGTDQKAVDVNQIMVAHNIETKRMVEERRSELGKIVSEVYRIEAIRDAGRNMRQSLNDLMRKNGPLLKSLAAEIPNLD